jgi:glycosyltransferase involved in cell wall biosynthesis
MRLLVLTPEYDRPGGGIATFYRLLAPELVAAGVTLRVIEGSAFHAAPDRACRVRDHVHIETLESARFARWLELFSAYAAVPGLRRHLAAAWAMWEQADRGKEYDIVEASDWGLLFVPPATEARPVVVQCHGSVGQIGVYDPIAGEETQSLLVRLIERAVIAIATCVQTCSNANAAFWRAETGREVIMLRPATPRPILEPIEPSPRGLVVGRLQRWKGPEILCAALERLGTRAPAVDWVGRDTAWGARENSTASHLSRTFSSVWGRRIDHCLPEAPHAIARRQAAALFNIVPSIWDVFNFTAVEAMASGRPTMVSTGAGASELIEDQVNGYLFASGDADALAAALDRLLSASPARLKAIGKAARETVRTVLDPKAIAAQRVAAYRSVIDAFDSQPPLPAAGWLGEICRPSELLQGSDMAFLDHLPFRAIAAHMLVRGRNKVTARITPQVFSR